MPTTRRDLIKLGSLAGLGGLAATTAAAPASVARAAQPLRILILGGTGFTGPHQVRYALARGHRITVFNRGKRKNDFPAAVEQLTGDRDTGDLEALRGREWDVCIDNPTSVPAWVRDAGKVLAGKVGQYIFISTISVYADTSKPGMDEDTATATYEGKDAMAETMAGLRANMALYGPLKALSEREAEKQFPGKATIIRPGLIVGPGDPTYRFSYWVDRLARGGEVLAPGDGDDPVQVIDVRDLASWLVRLGESDRGGAFDAVGPPTTTTMGELLGAVMAGVGHLAEAPARLTWVPAEFLETHDVAPWADLPAWLPRHDPAAALVRIDPTSSVRAGLDLRLLAGTAEDTLRWWLAQPEAERAAMRARAGLAADREAAVLDAWRSVA